MINAPDFRLNLSRDPILGNERQPIHAQPQGFKVLFPENFAGVNGRQKFFFEGSLLVLANGNQQSQLQTRRHHLCIVWQDFR